MLKLKSLLIYSRFSPAIIYLCNSFHLLHLENVLEPILHSKIMYKLWQGLYIIEISEQFPINIKK